MQALAGHGGDRVGEEKIRGQGISEGQCSAHAIATPQVRRSAGKRGAPLKIEGREGWNGSPLWEGGTLELEPRGGVGWALLTNTSPSNFDLFWTGVYLL